MAKQGSALDAPGSIGPLDKWDWVHGTAALAADPERKLPALFRMTTPRHGLRCVHIHDREAGR